MVNDDENVSVWNDLFNIDRPIINRAFTITIGLNVLSFLNK